MFKTARAETVERLEARYRKFAGEGNAGQEIGMRASEWTLGHCGCAREVLTQIRTEDSGLEETGGDAIVAVELHVIEGGGDSVPTGRGGGFTALHVSCGGEDNVTVPHGLADENDFDFEQSPGGKRFRAEEVDARGADITGDESDGKFLGDVVNTAQAQGELEGGARIDAVLRVNANGVRGHAGEAAGLRARRERAQTRWGHHGSVGRGVGNYLRSGSEEGQSFRCTFFRHG